MYADEPSQFAKFVKAIRENPSYPFVFANVLNNAVNTYFLQASCGKLASLPRVGASLPRPWNSHDEPSALVLDPTGWKDPNFAVSLHREVLRVGPQALRCANTRLEFDYRFSINVVGWHGPSLRLLGDEAWLLPTVRVVTAPGEAPALAP